MLATVLLFSLVVVAFWRSIFRLLIAGLLILLVAGGIQAVQAIGAMVTVSPQQTQCQPSDQHRC